jgi:hypothetical protein
VLCLVYCFGGGFVLVPYKKVDLGGRGAQKGHCGGEIDLFRNNYSLLLVVLSR